MDRNRILKSIKDLLAHTMPQGASVFLFGSQARGDYSSDSDWDEIQVEPLIEPTEMLLYQN